MFSDDIWSSCVVWGEEQLIGLGDRQMDRQVDGEGGHTVLKMLVLLNTYSGFINKTTVILISAISIE